jgi:predicted regulator of Ras-like GTPase activity (Roadblock/LC7/MglB family)
MEELGEPMPVVSMPLAPPAQAAQPLAASLASLAEDWPEAVRGEILRLNLMDAKLALPAQTVEQALKQGRVAFSWKAVRSWVRPAIAPATSPEDNTVLELPLRVIAPLFLARQRQAGQSRQKVSIDENIPNLFFGRQPQPPPSPAAPPPAPAPAPENNYYVWEDGSETVRTPQPEARPNPAAGTRFIAKYATPNEIVSRAAALDHVAGALIGLPDGLLVASRLGTDLNADTLAAFLPQIFGRVSQSTKELRMGDLNELSFTVGSTPWRLFRVNAIFFAAFGRPGQPLPGSELAALAAELDHKPR